MADSLSQSGHPSTIDWAQVMPLTFSSKAVWCRLPQKRC